MKCRPLVLTISCAVLLACAGYDGSDAPGSYGAPSNYDAHRGSDVRGSYHRNYGASNGSDSYRSSGVPHSYGAGDVSYDDRGSRMRNRSDAYSGSDTRISFVGADSSYGTNNGSDASRSSDLPHSYGAGDVSYDDRGSRVRNRSDTYSGSDTRISFVDADSSYGTNNGSDASRSSDVPSSYDGHSIHFVGNISNMHDSFDAHNDSLLEVRNRNIFQVPVARKMTVQTRSTCKEGEKWAYGRCRKCYGNCSSGRSNS